MINANNPTPAVDEQMVEIFISKVPFKDIRNIPRAVIHVALTETLALYSETTKDKVVAIPRQTDTHIPATIRVPSSMGKSEAIMHNPVHLASLPVSLTYTNYRGETSVRRITPLGLRFASTEWHPEPQWLLIAYDHDKGENRNFALKDFGKPVDVAAVRKALRFLLDVQPKIDSNEPFNGDQSKWNDYCDANHEAERALSPAEPVTNETFGFSKDPSTKDQIAAVFLASGTPKQKAEAISYAHGVVSPAEPVVLPQDVIDLVIAGRELVYSGEILNGSQEADKFDKALEAFASRVPWDNEPDEGAAPTSKGGE